LPPPVSAGPSYDFLKNVYQLDVREGERRQKLWTSREDRFSLSLSLTLSFSLFFFLFLSLSLSHAFIPLKKNIFSADPAALARLVSKTRVPADSAGCAALSAQIMAQYDATKMESSTGHDALINFLEIIEDDAQEYGVFKFECEVSMPELFTVYI
jgi:hypothetical protein